MYLSGKCFSYFNQFTCFMGNNLSTQQSTAFHGVLFLWVGSLTYQVYLLSQQQRHIMLSKRQSDNKMSEPGGKQRIDLRKYIEEQEGKLKKADAKFHDDWVGAELSYAEIVRKIRASKDEKNVLKVFCRNYETELQVFAHWSLTEEHKITDFDLEKRCEALKKLQTKRQIKLKEFRQTIEYLNRKFDLPIEDFKEEMEDHQNNIKKMNPAWGEQMVKNSPFPCLSILKSEYMNNESMQRLLQPFQAPQNDPRLRGQNVDLLAEIFAALQQAKQGMQQAERR